MNYHSQSSGSETSASKHASHIHAAANLANVHYARASRGGHTLSAVATALHALREALSSLQLQVRDPDSIFNTEDRYSGAGQLHALVEETIVVLDEAGKALVQAEDDREDGYNVDYDELARVKRRLEDQKQSIQELRDRAQSRKNPPPVPPKISPAGLNDLTETLERVTAKVFNDRGSRLGGSDDELREQLTSELDKEGFPRHILENHKDILEAYIHLLKTKALQGDGQVPSVRRLLKQGSPPLSSPVSSPKDESDRDRFSPVVRSSLTFPSHSSSSPRHHDISTTPRYPRHTSTGLSYDPTDDGSSSTSDSDSMALISTRDLVEMDDRQEKGYPLYPLPPQFTQDGFPKNYTFSPGTSPNPRTTFLPPAGTYPALPELSASPLKSKSTPRWAALQSPNTPPPEDLAIPQGQLVPQAGANHALGVSSEHLNRRASDLGPDGQGKPISMDATWTRIKRSLVSPEVLQKEGVRYEARPAFVAVLGALSKDRIAELARKSAEVRAARAKRANSRNAREAEAERGSRKNSNPSELDDEESDTSSRSSTSALRSRPRHSSSYHLEGSDTAARRPRSRLNTDSIAEGDDSDSYEGGRPSPKAKSELFIVPSEANTASPSAMAQPKSILKNKNENHVRFDTKGPYEVSSGSVRPDRSSRIKPSDIAGDKSSRSDDGGMERDRERERQRREREKEREEGDRRQEERRRRDRERDRERERDRDRDRERDRDRVRDRDKDRERDRETDLPDRYDSKYKRQPRQSTWHGDTRSDYGSYRRHRSRSRQRDDDHNRSSHRNQSRDRSPERRSEKQRRLDREKKRQYAEAVSIAGWGGAAASLLGLLVETLY